MRPRALLALLLLAAPALAGCQDDADADGPVHVVVETTTGDVRGEDHAGVTSWRGIPYAERPRRRDRFRRLGRWPRGLATTREEEDG